MISEPPSRLTTQPPSSSSIPPRTPVNRSVVRSVIVCRKQLPPLRTVGLAVALVALAVLLEVLPPTTIRGTFVTVAAAASARNQRSYSPLGGRSLLLRRYSGNQKQQTRHQAGSSAAFFDATIQISHASVPRRSAWWRSPNPISRGATMAFASSSSDSKEQHDSKTAFSAATRRLESPSAERNKGPIWEVLSTRVIPRLQRGNYPWTILETAAGAGVHTEHFVTELLRMVTSETQNANNGDGPAGQPPSFVWHPSDPSLEALESIAARVEDHKTTLGGVVAAPKQMTLASSGIQEEEPSDNSGGNIRPLDLVISINMIHIAPWEATLGLMKVAGQRLRAPTDSDNDGGYLYCYGPYKQDGILVPSNENFDANLKSRNPDWGVRKLADVVRAAEEEGLELVEKVEMPANNTSLIFRRRRKIQ